MPDIIKTIGSGGDYPDLPTWWSAMKTANTSPSASSARWIAKLLLQEFLNGSSSILVMDRIACTSSFYPIIQCNSGASWKDNSGVRSNAFYYNATNGAGIKLGAGSFDVAAIQCGCDYTRFSGLQIFGSDASGLLGRAIELTDGASHIQIDHSILLGDYMAIKGASGADVNLYNNLIIQSRAGNGSSCITMAGGATWNIKGNTLIHTGGDTSHGYCLFPFGGTVNLKDNAIFNFLQLLDPSAGGGYTLNATYNGTDLGTLSGTGNVTGLSYGSQFQSNSPSYDFRSKTTGGLLIGSPDSDILDDASGFTRGGSTIWSGGWEAASAGAIPGTVSILSFTTTTATIRITGTTGATGTIHNQLQHSLDGGSTWANVGSSVTGATATLPVDTGLAQDSTVQWKVLVTDDVATSTSSIVSMTMPEVMVYCVGDSITAGHIGGVNTTSYCEYLQTLLGSKFGVVNLGGGGAKLEDMIAIDYSTYFDPFAKANFMWLQGGFNDWNSESDTALAIIADLQVLASKNRSLFTVGRIGLMPAVESSWPGYGAVQAAVLAAEKANWQAWGFKGFADIPEITTMSDPSNTTYYASTPHTSDAGNQQMANVVAAVTLEMMNELSVNRFLRTRPNRLKR